MLKRTKGEMYKLISVFLAALAFISFVDLGTTKTIQKRSAVPDSANVTIREYCIKQVGISEALVKEIEESEDEESEGKEVPEKFYCYMMCVLTTGGIIDKDGKMDVDEFLENIDPDIDVECLNKLPKITECTDMAELDKCGESKPAKKSK